MTSSKISTPAVDTEDGATRVGPMHEAFAAFLNAEFQAGITAQQIFLVTSKRKAFRSTDSYRVGVKAAQEQAKEQAAEAREKVKADRAAAAAAKKAEQEQAAAAKAAPVEQKAPAAKPATKKATPTKTQAAAK